MYFLLYYSAISVLHGALKKAIAVLSVIISQTSLIRYFQTFCVSILRRQHYEGNKLTENSMTDFCACILNPLFATVHNLGHDVFV